MELNDEQKLKKAFLQFIGDVWKMRKEQQEYFSHRYHNVRSRQYREKIVDEDLASMGINDDTDFENGTIMLDNLKSKK